MGQRHQAFLIARIIPHGETDAKYRCVAAMHHHWCFGSLPLRAARRLLTLLKKPEHSKIVVEEIRALDGKYGRWRVFPKTPEVPCPFSSFLMFSAFNVDLCDNPEDFYVSYGIFRHNLLDSNMGSFGGDNDDGITVIDITDPTNPAYCFVFLEGTLKGIPLTATDYIREYYPVPKSGEQNDEGFPEETVLNVIAALEGERLVTSQMLVEAWFSEYKRYFKKQAQVFETDFGLVPTVPQIPFLSELTLKPAIVHALETGDTKDIEQLPWLPGKVETIIEILKSYKPFPDSGVSLLAQATNHLNPQSVDISSFSLSAAQIVSLLTNFSHVEILDLSHNPLVTADTVSTVLESVPTLKHLVLLDTSVTDEALSSLLRDHPRLFFSLEILIHPLLLNDEISRFPNAFAILVENFAFVTGASIPLFTPSFIVQALADYLRAYLLKSFDSVIDSDLPRVVLSSTIRKVTEGWGNRTIPMIASSSLSSAINGEGWIFGVKRLGDNGLYGFIEAKPDEIDTSESMSASGNNDSVARVLGLEDFLTEIESQGRPPAPASAVDALRAILDQLKAPPDPDSRRCCSFRLMTASEANVFIASSKLSPR